MEVIETKTNQDLLSSVVAEIAKATNEINCARGDLDKASRRLSFVIFVTNELLKRTKDQQDQK